jgi:hypothetical protein
MRSKAAALHRRITSYHEAAHAVIAFRFGISVEEVVLCNVIPTDGYVQYSRTALVYQALRYGPSAEFSWPVVARDTKRRAMVSLAGSLAEAKLLGTTLRSNCCEFDLQKVLGLCRALSRYRHWLVDTEAPSIPEEDPIRLANRLRKQTRGILGHPVTWRAVTALGHELEGCRRLTGYEAADTAQWVRRIHNQLTLLLPMPRQTDSSSQDTVAVGHGVQWEAGNFVPRRRGHPGRTVCELIGVALHPISTERAAAA